MSLTSSFPRLLRRILALLTAVVLISWGTAALSSADAVENTGVCSGLDSGKIDVSGEPSSLTLTAPEGQLISGYCVKAASEQNGGGPEYVTLSEPQESVTISHPTGKGISHYSLDYTPADNEPKVCEEGTDHEGMPYPDGTEASCNDDEPDVCDEGTDHEGLPYPDGTEASCNDEPGEGGDDVCDEGTDHEGMPYPDGTEASCNDEPGEGGDDVCEEGTDHEGLPYPDGTEASCDDEPGEGGDDVCEEGTDHEGMPFPDGTEASCNDGPGGDNPGGDNPGGDNPGGNTPGGNTPGGNTPGGNTPGGTNAGDTEVLGAQASIGAGAPSGAGSSAPSADAQQVPTAVNAGIEDPDAAPTGLPSALALLMVAFGLFAFGMAITPSRRTSPRHRQS